MSVGGIVVLLDPFIVGWYFITQNELWWDFSNNWTADFKIHSFLCPHFLVNNLFFASISKFILVFSLPHSYFLQLLLLLLLLLLFWQLFFAFFCFASLAIVCLVLAIFIIVIFAALPLLGGTVGLHFHPSLSLLFL